MLSYFEVAAIDRHTLRLAVYTNSRTCANMRERGKATLIVVDDRVWCATSAATVTELAPAMRAAPYNAKLDLRIEQVVFDEPPPDLEPGVGVTSGITLQSADAGGAGPRARHPGGAARTMSLYETLKTELVGWFIVSLLLPGAIATAVLDQITPLDRGQLWAFSVACSGVIFVALVYAGSHGHRPNEAHLWYAALAISLAIVAIVLSFGFNVRWVGAFLSRFRFGPELFNLDVWIPTLIQIAITSVITLTGTVVVLLAKAAAIALSLYSGLDAGPSSERRPRERAHQVGHSQTMVSVRRLREIPPVDVRGHDRGRSARRPAQCRRDGVQLFSLLRCQGQDAGRHL